MLSGVLSKVDCPRVIFSDAGGYIAGDGDDDDDGGGGDGDGDGCL